MQSVRLLWGAKKLSQGYTICLCKPCPLSFAWQISPIRCAHRVHHSQTKEFGRAPHQARRNLEGRCIRRAASISPGQNQTAWLWPWACNHLLFWWETKHKRKPRNSVRMVRAQRHWNCCGCCNILGECWSSSLGISTTRIGGMKLYHDCWCLCCHHSMTSQAVTRRHL